MKKTLKNVVITALSVCMLLGLCSCRLEESYKEFFIKNITDNLNDDYFTSENFSFARLQDVAIIPQVKEINHGVYILYISVYSESGNETVRINKAVFKEKESVLFTNEIDKVIEFKENEKTIYEGLIDGGTFTADSLEVADGKEYDLVIEAEVEKNGVIISESITYEIIIKGYKSFVWPT